MPPRTSEPRPLARETVAHAVAATLAELGASTAFGLIGSGNIVVSNHLVAVGAEFITARHEGAAAAMADGWARVNQKVGIVTIHQGPGLTNTLTALAEAAKARTPLLVVAADTPAPALDSNFRIDQSGLVACVGAGSDRVYTPDTVAADVVRAYKRAVLERRPIVLMIPVDLQSAAVPGERERATLGAMPSPPVPSPELLDAAVELLDRAARPFVLGGRGAVLGAARDAIEAFADRAGAVLATTAMAKGLFRGSQFSLGIVGGFGSALAQELAAEADLLVAFGASLNKWTTNGGELFAAARLIQVDTDPGAIGRHKPADVAMVGGSAETAAALASRLGVRGKRRWRSRKLASRIATERWRDQPYEDRSTESEIDPRTATTALDDLLPRDRAVAVDSGHFLGFPSFYLEVPDAHAWLFMNGFMAVGLGLSAAIGAAVADRSRPTVAAVGDGGAFLALAELETAVRLALPLLVVIYNDSQYGAEVHHFRRLGETTDLAEFPDTDFARIAESIGAEAATVRVLDDLQAVSSWLERIDRPLVLDVKVCRDVCADWLEHAFSTA